VTPEMLVFTRGHEIRAINKSSLWIEEIEDPNARPVRKLSLGAIAWSIACSDPVGASVVRASASNETSDWPKGTQVTNPPLVVAGHTIVAGTLNSKIVTADTESRAVVMTTELDGLALGLAVATGPPDDREVHPEPYQVNRPYHQMAQEIVTTTGIAEGYCVDLACGDGSLAHALAEASELHVIAVDDDPSKVALARRKLSNSQDSSYRGDP